MKNRFLTASLCAFDFGLCALLMLGCSTAPRTETARDQLHENVVSAQQRLDTVDPSFESFIHNADGYVIFPTVGKGALIAGGAYGHGEVFEQGRFIGYADISQATLGLQAGAQGYMEAIVFETSAALAHFKAGQLTFTADASAVAMKAGAASSARYANGVVVFAQPLGGLMAEAAIGGQTFSFQPSNGDMTQSPAGLAGTGNQ